jgi:hypothetical protein
VGVAHRREEWRRRGVRAVEGPLLIHLLQDMRWGGFRSPEPEAAVAVVCEDGVAGELDGESEGRRDLV